MQVRLNDTATCMGDNSEPEGRLLRAEGSPGLRCFIYIYILSEGWRELDVLHGRDKVR